MVTLSHATNSKVITRSSKMRSIKLEPISSNYTVIENEKYFILQTISEINGLQHKSGYDKLNVETNGVVTVKTKDGFYLQDGTNTIYGSSGIFVFTENQRNYLNMVSIGDSIKIRGKVVEFGSRNDLPITKITSITELTVLSKKNPLPSPIDIGKKYNNVPSLVIDNGNINDFDQHAHAIDYWENYESMLVKIDSPKVVGKLFNNIIFAVTLDMDNPNRITTTYGGVQKEKNGNTDVVLISNSLMSLDPNFSNVNPGDSISHITGVVSYANGNFYLLPRDISDIGTVKPGKVSIDLSLSTSLTPPAYVNDQKLSPLEDIPHISIITQNMFNFSSKPNMERMAKYARDNLLSPEIMFMQEVQDDSGPIDDGTVSSSSNLDELCKLLNNPYYDFPSYPKREYTYVYVSPANNEDGGKPGGNIRVAIVYDALSISIEKYDRIGLPNSTPPVTNNTFLATRKPLYAKIKHIATNEIYHLIAVHFVVQITDSDWGWIQPPKDVSETRRTQQTIYIKDWITHNLNKNDNVVVAGDFNDFEWSNSLQVLDDNTPNRFMKNLVNDVKESERYSYYFRGTHQTLDHIIVSLPLYHKIINVFKTDVNIPNKPYIKFSDVLTSQFWIQKIGEPILCDHNTLCARIPL